MSPTVLPYILTLALVTASPSSPAAASERFGSLQVTRSGSGPATLLVPGLACSGAVWDAVVAYYRGRYECHVVELPGFAGQAPIGSPVLLVAAGAGSHSEAERLALGQAYDAQVAGVADHRVVVAGAARHFIMLDDPLFLLAAMDQFLAPVPSR